MTVAHFLNLSNDVLLIVGIYSCYDDVNKFFFVQLGYSLRN